MEDQAGASFRVDLRAIVDGLVKMVRYRDEATATHLDAVGRLARGLGAALGYDEPTLERVRLEREEARHRVVDVHQHPRPPFLEHCRGAGHSRRHHGKAGLAIGVRVARPRYLDASPP